MYVMKCLKWKLISIQFDRSKCVILPVVVRTWCFQCKIEDSVKNKLVAV